MNEQEALALMVPPSKQRPCWRGGIVQIHVTRACDKACFGCTQGSNLGGKPVMVTVEQFEQMVLSLEGYFGVFGVFGGNPAMHPKFDQLCEVLRRHVPFEQCGLWCNKLLGHGPAARRTFNPKVSNLNVHLDRAAYDEFWRDWPEARRVLKGHNSDSRHAPPFVAMKDVIRKPCTACDGMDHRVELTFDLWCKACAGQGSVPDEARAWELIAGCDVNQHWSAMVCHVPGKGLRAFFCELAGAQAMLHADDPDWPDTGLAAEPGWWRRPMADFAQQVRVHCHSCGVPLRRFGQLAIGGDHEEVSATHQGIYKVKAKGRRVELVTVGDGPTRTLEKMTNYLQNGGIT